MITILVLFFDKNKHFCSICCLVITSGLNSHNYKKKIVGNNSSEFSSYLVMANIIYLNYKKRLMVIITLNLLHIWLL